MNIDNLEEVVNYINAELIKDRTYKEIETELGFGDRVLYKRLVRGGYKRADDDYKLFVLQDVDKDNTKQDKADIKPPKSKAKPNNQLTNEDVKKLKELINRYDDIVYMLDTYSKCNTDDIQVIQTYNTKQRMFRVDVEVLEKWNEFCEEYKHIKVQSLISSALNEYIEKYSKK